MSRAEVAIPSLTPPAPNLTLVSPPGPGAPPAPSQLRTIWGLDPIQLHTRYWASNGVQVVRQGEPSEIVKHAELFLLTEPSTLTMFRLADVMDALNWIKPQVLFVRLHDSRERGYREFVVTDEFDQFVRFERRYDASGRLTRVVLTPDRDVAKLWQSAPDGITGWRRLRRFIPRTDRATVSINGNLYDRSSNREVAFFIHDLVARWRRPDSTVLRAMPAQGQAWRDAQAKIDPNAKFIGPVWVGCGRQVAAETTVVGPAVIWDDPENRPVNDDIHWLHIEPSPAPDDAPQPRPGSPLDRAFKRAFDIAFATAAIIFTLPLYPLIMIAIWIEDGRPFFFSHKRETLGGREFPCVKFRSMRKDAEKMKAVLKKLNRADGPQFFIENDPRLLRVGRFLRKYNLDELPQFWNVLVGDMSIVGPRPSPHKENQYCPPWREARLSVRPGITGLWQVKRTRRAGSDFQEWIKYDLEYVEKRNWWLDLKIIWQTIMNILGKVSRSD
ncbi:MAG TPA: sugar transferase [Tepidisphaeraceae bacterium]|nr:sugar transferase [Tepidisphaeraceae bacterium]